MNPIYNSNIIHQTRKMLDANKWNTKTGHLLRCSRDNIIGCDEINRNGTPCKKREQLSRQSCDIGYGSFCAIHYKLNLGPQHDVELSTCANKRCDELNLSLEERKDIHQFNIQEILGLPSLDIFNHVSKNRQKRFNWNIVPGIDSDSESESKNDYLKETSYEKISYETSDDDEMFSEDDDQMVSEDDDEMVSDDEIFSEDDLETETSFIENSEDNDNENVEMISEEKTQNTNYLKRKNVELNLQVTKKPKYS